MYPRRIDPRELLALVAVVMFLSGVLVFVSQWIWPAQ